MSKFPRSDSIGIALPLLALIVPVSSSAHDLPPVTYPPLPAEAANAEGFVPSGWKIENQAEGDVDGDSRADLALVLRSQDPANVLPVEMCGDKLDTNPSMLAVLLAKPGGGYRRAVENHVLIARRENSCALDGL